MTDSLGMDNLSLTWKMAAFKIGEELAPTGPNGYYDMKPEEWYNWASCQIAKSAPTERPVTDDDLDLLVIAIQALTPHQPDANTHDLAAVDRGREILRNALARWGRPPTTPALAAEEVANEDVEAAAQIIYGSMRFDRIDSTSDWVPNGNSLAQDEARRCARAALAAVQSDGPAVPEGYIDPEHQEGDRALLEAFYEACLAEGGTADEITLRGLHAVLARWGRPATPAAGEVGELVAKLRRLATQNSLGIADPTITRAATLLEQQQARIAELEADPIRKAQAAVDDLRVALNRMNLESARIQKGFLANAVERPDIRYEFSIFGEDYAEQAGGSAPTYAQALDEGQRYLAKYQQDGVHTLELRRVEVLPIPQEES